MSIKDLEPDPFEMPFQAEDGPGLKCLFKTWIRLK